jgi:hypothetical protein
MRFPIPTNSSPSLITKYSAGRDIYSETILDISLGSIGILFDF